MPATPPPRSAFRERLGMYLLGVAIGLVLMGLLFMARQNAARRHAAPQQPPQTVPAPSS